MFLYWQIFCTVSINDGTLAKCSLFKHIPATIWYMILKLGKRLLGQNILFYWNKTFSIPTAMHHFDNQPLVYKKVTLTESFVFGSYNNISAVLWRNLSRTIRPQQWQHGVSVLTVQWPWYGSTPVCLTMIWYHGSQNSGIPRYLVSK